MNSFLKVIIILIALFLVAGLWVYKNYDDLFTLKPIEPNELVEPIQEPEPVPEQIIPNSVFELEITTAWKVEDYTKYGLPVIIDFGAVGCPACDHMAPYIKELNQQLIGKAIIKSLDVWKYPNLYNGYNFAYIPTLVFFNSDGTPYVPKNNQSYYTLHYDKNGKHDLTSYTGVLYKEELIQILKEMGLR